MGLITTLIGNVARTKAEEARERQAEIKQRIAIDQDVLKGEYNRPEVKRLAQQDILNLLSKHGGSEGKKHVPRLSMMLSTLAGVGMGMAGVPRRPQLPPSPLATLAPPGQPQSPAAGAPMGQSQPATPSLLPYDPRTGTFTPTPATPPGAPPRATVATPAGLVTGQPVGWEMPEWQRAEHDKQKAEQKATAEAAAEDIKEKADYQRLFKQAKAAGRSDQEAQDYALYNATRPPMHTPSPSQEQRNDWIQAYADEHNTTPEKMTAAQKIEAVKQGRETLARQGPGKPVTLLIGGKPVTLDEKTDSEGKLHYYKPGGVEVTLPAGGADYAPARAGGGELAGEDKAYRWALEILANPEKFSPVDVSTAKAIKEKFERAAGETKPIVPRTPAYRVAEDLADGKLTFAQFRSLYPSRSSNQKEAIYDKARELNPNFDAAQFEAGYKFASNPKVRQQLSAIDNVRRGVEDLLKFSDAADRAGATVLNEFVVPGGVALGGEAYVNLEAARVGFADELSGALGFGSATDMSRKMGFDMTNSKLSPQNFRSNVLKVVVPFLQRKWDSLQNQMGPYGKTDEDTGGIPPAPVRGKSPPPEDLMERVIKENGGDLVKTRKVLVDAGYKIPK
jgi:hypothetical protein